jgi:hypothetical protein
VGCRSDDSRGHRNVFLSTRTGNVRTRRSPATYSAARDTNYGGQTRNHSRISSPGFDCALGASCFRRSVGAE